MYGESYDDVGYEVEEIGAAAKSIQQIARASGVRLPQSAAMTLAARQIALATPRGVMLRPQMTPGRGSTLGTSCGLGTATFAAATVAATIVNLQARAEEPFTAVKIVIQRSNYAAVPPSVGAGIPVLVLDVRIGQRSVLANGAGLPVEAFDPQGTGGQQLATGARVERSALITVQFQLGAIAVPAGENIYLTAAVYGRE